MLKVILEGLDNLRLSSHSSGYLWPNSNMLPQHKNGFKIVKEECM